MNEITNSEVVALMILAAGTFVICALAIVLVIRCNWRNRTNMPDKSTEKMPDCLLDKWTENEQTGY